MDIIFAGGQFRAKSKFANIAKISSTRKIGVIQYIYIGQFELLLYIIFRNSYFSKVIMVDKIYKVMSDNIWACSTMCSHE